MLGFNRGYVRVLCFFGPKTLKANSNLAHTPWTYKTRRKEEVRARYQVGLLGPIGLVIFFSRKPWIMAY